MNKNEPIITVNNREMGSLGARLYLFKLRLGLVKAELSEEEKADYTKWKALGENRNDIAKKRDKEAPYSNLSERAYVIEKLGNKLESLSSQDYRKVHLHIPKKGSEYTPSGVEGAVTSYVCRKCGQVYEENISKKPISNPFRG